MPLVDPVRALLVEDSPADATLARCFLEDSLGPATLTRCAERLSAALRCLENETFDVVILDLLLPDNAGLEGLRRIVSSHPALPVVILSGVDDKDVEAEAFHQGAQEFLLKGGKVEDLGRAVERAIARKRMEAELAGSLGSPAGSLIVGDSIVSAARPAEVLVIGSPGIDVVRRATEKYAGSFVLFEAASLDDARRMLTRRSFDAVVLHPDLPDAWATHAYAILIEFTGDIPVLVLSDAGHGMSRIPAQLPRPFGEIRKSDSGTTKLRRLLVSATLQRRALEMPLDAPGREEPIPQPHSNWWH